MASGTSIPLSSTQQDLTAVETVVATAASPFIKSAAGQQKEQLVLAETNLFIQALPLLKDLYNSLGLSKLGNLFHHTHQAVTAATTVPAGDKPAQ